MKLLNHTTKYFAFFLLLIIALWAVVFYYVMLVEIYDSMDDSLENQKMLVIQTIEKDSSILEHDTFQNQYFLFKRTSKDLVLQQKDHYFDTLIFMQNEEEYEPVRALRSGVKVDDDYYQMLVITSMVEEDDLMASLLYSIIALYLGLVGTILVTNNILLKRIWSPFHALLIRLKKFRVDRTYNATPIKTNVDEFRLLNEAVEKLIAKNISIFQMQKEFIENASHELQTPLAISLNKLELLAGSEGLNEEQVGLVAETIENLQRLSALNKSLLLLAKIENKQFPAAENILINELIEKILSDFNQLKTYKTLTVELIQNSTIRLSANPDLLRILFTNLIKNALIHNAPGGFVKITIEGNSVIIENSGEAKLDESKIFLRFEKQSNKQISTGLGLSIARAIADNYGYTIKYTFTGKHSFQIFFNHS